MLSHVSRATSCEVLSVSLRRPDVVLRHTRYANVVVDERMLTAAFPWISSQTRLLAVLVVGGRIDWPGLTAVAGEAIVLLPEHMALGRFDDVSLLELEWASLEARHIGQPTRVGTVAEPALELITRLLDPDADQRLTFAMAFEAFAASGVAHGLGANPLEGGPTPSEARLARALDVQFASLATAADTLHLAELAGVSPRQVHRLMSELIQKMQLNARSWRDLRNRWRVQLAAVLLGDPQASVASIAAEVGYASAPALARALASAGLPSPREIRRRLRGASGNGSESDMVAGNCGRRRPRR